MTGLTALLDKTLRETRFDAKDLGTYTATDMRGAHIPGAQNWFRSVAADTVVPKVLLTALVERLEHELQAYIEPKTRRIGIGLFNLMGGAQDAAEPEIADFARTLVRAAALLGSTRTVNILRGWIKKKPYRYRMKAILTGVQCSQPLALPQGVRVEELPLSGSVSDLASHLPLSLFGEELNTHSLFGRTVLTIDGTAAPDLYRPARVRDNRPPRNLWAGGSFPCLTTDEWRQRLSEVLSIACDHYVGWTHIWHEVNDLNAFHPCGSGYGYRLDDQPLGGATVLKQQHLELAHTLDIKRHDRKREGRSPEVAIKRWVSSKRPGAALSNRFIDLRIALEALYTPRDRNELSFRIAMLGAWQLGSDFEARRKYYALLRKAYKRGSDAVHSGDVADNPDNRDTLLSAQCACRKAILQSLEATERPVWDEVVAVALGAALPRCPGEEK